MLSTSPEHRFRSYFHSSEAVAKDGIAPLPRLLVFVIGVVTGADPAAEARNKRDGDYLQTEASEPGIGGAPFRVSGLVILSGFKSTRPRLCHMFPPASSSPHWTRFIPVEPTTGHASTMRSGSETVRGYRRAKAQKLTTEHHHPSRSVRRRRATTQRRNARRLRVATPDIDRDYLN